MAGLLTSGPSGAGLLEATLRRWAAEPCALFPCGLDVWAYCCARAGREVAPLPEHQQRRQMTALLRAHGGLASYAGSLIEPLGWRRTEALQRGDVGVIDLPKMGKTCALFTGERWAVRGDCMVALVRPLELLRSWTWGGALCLRP